MQFQLTCYLELCLGNYSSFAESYLLHTDDRHWSIKKLAAASFGSLIECAPILATMLVVRAVFSKMTPITGPILSVTGSILLGTACFVMTSLIASRVSTYILKYLKNQSGVTSYSTQQLLRFMKKPVSVRMPRYLHSSYQQQQVACTVEYVKRYLKDRESQNLKLLELMPSLNPPIIRIIQAYNHSIPYATINQLIYRRYDDAESQLQLTNLINKLICEPTERYHIEEQIQLILALPDKKEQISALQHLYEFHRNEGDYVAVVAIIKNSFKFMFASLFFCNEIVTELNDRVRLDESSKDLSDLLKKRDMVKNIIKNILQLDDTGRFSDLEDLFFQHYLDDAEPDMECIDFVKLNNVFHTLLFAWESEENRSKFRNELIIRLFPQIFV